MTWLRLASLSRAHEGAARPALAGLTLDVARGEILVVVGPSGCGKSTALRLIAGLDAPTSGTVTIDGRDVTRVAPQDRDVAMVFQGYALYPHLTVRDNMAFPLRMRGAPAAEREARVRETAALLGIEPLLGRRPGELSGGERQRVAMGRAIVRSPKVFLFDEPLSNLDAALRAELRVELAALVRRLGTTSLYVTHDQVEAMTVGDRVAVLRAGELQQLGTAREVYERPANTFVATFLGSPPMSLVELEAEGGRARREGVDWPLPAGLTARGRVFAGVRPEHARFADGEAAPHEVAVGASVTAVEPLGAESTVHLDVAGARLVARAAGFDAPALGSAARLLVDTRRLSWFDAATGHRIEPAG
jgi:multiple sugar transport system ATP-binding protein